MRGRPLRATGLALGLALGCSPLPEAPPPKMPVRPTGLPPSTAPMPPSALAAPSLRVVLTPDGATGELVVDVTAEGAPEQLTTWNMPVGLALERLSASDRAGPLPIAPGELLHFSQPPAGPVRILARVPSSALGPDAPAVWVDPDRFEARGEAVLPLPRAFLGVAVPVRLTLSTTGYGGPLVRAGSTFGAAGEKAFTATAADLARATYAAGPAGMAFFDAPEGHDEALWIGYTAFDPRPIAADVASFRTAARGVFGDPSGGPATLLILSDARRPGAFHVERRSGGMALHVGAQETWSAPLRLAVATATLQRWIGGELWIGPEGERRGEALWFTEGLARFLARDLLFRFGLITAEEVATEVEGQLGLILTSPHADRTEAELAQALSTPGVVPLLSARGALYAARVDHALRRRSGGKTTLTTVLRALLAEARAKNAALPRERFIAVVGETLGGGAAADLERELVRGEAAPLPAGALGPCLRERTRTYAAFALGFDEVCTKAAVQPRVCGVVPSSPAHRAGLRDGEELVRLRHEPGRTDVEVEVTVRRGDREVTLRYLPVGKRAAGQGFTRTDVPADRCTP